MPEEKKQIIVSRFEEICQKRGYSTQISEIQHGVRVTVSNLKDRANIDIFNTGTVSIGGRASPFKEELELIKREYEKDPIIFAGISGPVTPACYAKYDIVNKDTRQTIRKHIESISSRCNFTETPNVSTTYRAAIVVDASSITVTQYENGTLLIQGKKDHAFDMFCDAVETVASPAPAAIVARFLGHDEAVLQRFVDTCTPQLLLNAEDEVRDRVKDLFTYLTDHDRNWFIASRALCVAGIPLPEYSPYAMPVAKGFEGFSKKVLTDIGLFPQSHFQTRGSTFAALSDTRNAQRQALCKKDIHMHSMLQKHSVVLGTTRNFLMHSDGSTLTKVETLEKAKGIVDRTMQEARELYDYYRSMGLI